MNVFEKFDFTVDDENSGKRLDVFLGSLLDDYSRTQIQSLIDRGFVSVAGKDVLVKKIKIKSGDKVSIVIPEEAGILPERESIPLDIAYEDEDIIVVDKPQGTVVHAGAGNYTGTLVNALLAHCDTLSDAGGELRPGIVHRIDKDTSGLIVAAKNNEAHEALAIQFKEHTVERRYLGIIRGGLNPAEGVIDKPIARNPRNRLKMGVVEGGKRAVTRYRLIERLSGFSLVEFTLETGRTHQIRVHTASIGHPILGDELYGGSDSRIKCKGQTLHAEILGFIHPKTGIKMRFESDLPEYFKKIVMSIERL